ncbi:DUF1800 domain-containing protein [Mycobacterium sp. 050128]|uniref:DUF1800 domain-containing protein n=1 Tax=Mycobacterium sp. 050128 TaxID=3096112 RepID=UPI002ED842D9
MGQTAQWMTVARVLRRAGFGVTGPEVDAAISREWPGYVDAMLAGDPAQDPGAIATPLPRLQALRAPGKGATQAARKEFNHQVSEQESMLSSWWLRRMVTVGQPVHEKLAVLWHNHFATSAQKVRSAAHMAAQNEKLRTLSLGDFRALAYAMLTDAAMLRWLDGQSNTAKAPNENLAREFMELFALGHGNGYTEDDVRAGARALTGWVIDPDGQTSLTPKRHDSGGKTMFGLTRNFDAAGFCDTVLAQPKSAEYVAGRLWQQLASDEPASPQVLGRLVAAYGPERDLRALTRAILTDEEFTANRAAVVNTPIEWLVGVMRALRVPVDKPEVLKMADATLKALGQRPFYPPSVGGWPHGQVWLSTASAEARLRAAARLAHFGDLSGIESVAPADRIDAVGYWLGIGSWSDRSADALDPLVRKPPQLVAAAVNTPEYLTS